jgi:nucleoside-diphosphate-sugar epimerase
MVETDPVHPQNLYALTKFAAEEACRFYSARYGVESASLRIFPPYGPADNARRMVPYVIGSLLRGEKVQLTTGKQQWDFVYVGDIADAYLAVLRRPGAAAAAGVLNVGTSEPHSVREVVETLKEITGSVSELAWGAVPHRATEVWFNSADIHRIGHVLGWQPKVPLRDGLRRTIDWYRAQEGDHAGE